MALLGKWTGGVDADLDPGTTWAEPTTLFPTEDRNDSGAYGKSNATITLPASDLADGYLFIGGYEFEDTSNGRCNPQARFIQASGTGNFVSGTTGGYNRDNSEDRSYVRTWAIVDNPSASATFTFQWKRDADAPNTGDGTVRSELQVIPLYYSDIGLYTSTSTTRPAGTTPTVVTGFSGTDGTNITIASNVVSCTGDNKRYLVLSSQFYEGGDGSRTQRWHGLDIDGVQKDAAKAYSYYRNASNDESGDMFTWMFETVTATVTIEQTCYLGDGIGNDQGGADVSGGTTVTTGAHSLVVIELNDSAEVFLSRDTTVSANLATTGPIDLQVNTTTDFNDTASFTDLVDPSINCVQTADYLFGANVSAASGIVSSGSRWTAYAEFTINGTEDSDSVAGDYLRNQQTSQDTFGWSANLLGFQGLTAGDDVGVSVTELSGSEGGGGDVASPAGWTGFWGINLDTLSAAASTTMTADAGSYSLSGTTANTEHDEVLTGGAGSYALSGADATTTDDFFAFDDAAFDVLAFDDTAFNVQGAAAAITLTAEAGGYTLTGAVAGTEYHPAMDAVAGSYSLTGTAANTEYHPVTVAAQGSYSLSGQDVNFLIDITLTGGVGAYVLSGTDANTEFDEVITAGAGAYALTGQDAGTAKGTVTAADTGSYSLTGADATTLEDEITTAGVGSYSLTGQDATTTTDIITSGDAGSYALTGQDASFSLDEVIQGESGSYSLTGQVANTEFHEVITAVAGSYILSGQDVGFLINVSMIGGAGAYSLTGVSAATEKTAAGFAFDNLAFDSLAFDADAFSIGAATVLTGESGSYSLTGADANTLYSPATIAGAGTYTLTGQDVTFTLAMVMPAAAGSYSLSGQDATTTTDIILSGEAGNYSLSGQDVGFTFTLSAGLGNYSLTGEDAVLSQVTIASVGNYALTGTAANTEFDEIIPAGAGGYSLSGTAIASFITVGYAFDDLAFDVDAFDFNAFSMQPSGSQVATGGVGAYTLTGAAAALISPSTEIIGAGVGTYTYAGATVDTFPVAGMTAVPLTVDFIDLHPNSPFYGTPGLSDLETGDIIIHDNLVIGYSISMSGDGLFTISPTPVTTQFDIDYFIYDVSDGTTGTTEQITVLATTVMGGAAGAYSLTGAVANTEEFFLTNADAGSYTLTGTDADTFEAGGETITAEAGSYALTGQDAVTEYGRPISAESGTYTLAGEDVVFLLGDYLRADSAEYNLRGKDVTTIAPNRIIPFPSDRNVQTQVIPRKLAANEYNRTSFTTGTGRNVRTKSRGRTFKMSKKR